MAGRGVKTNILINTCRVEHEPYSVLYRSPHLMTSILRSSYKPSTRRQRVSNFGPHLQPTGETSKAGVRPKNVKAVATRLTQEVQNEADDVKQQEALHDLVQTWLERLQLISVITSFFAGIEISLLGKSSSLSTIGQIANVCFICALVIHVHAAIISFLGAFFLIKHKLAVAQREEHQADNEMIGSPTSVVSADPEKMTSPYSDNLRTDTVRGRVRVNTALSGDQIIWSTDPHLVQVGPFRGQPPTLLLSRCHSLCLHLSSIGFILALVGMITFAWSQPALSVSVFSTIAMASCWISGIFILIFPSTKTSHIFYEQRSR